MVFTAGDQASEGQQAKNTSRNRVLGAGNCVQKPSNHVDQQVVWVLVIMDVY